MLLGIDIGTTSVKADLYDEHGVCVGTARQDYMLRTPDVDQVELDAQTYWEAVQQVVRQALAVSGLQGADVYARTGIPEVNPTWTACKIAWLRAHRPRVFEKAHKFLLVQDFIVHRLTGEFVTEGSVACTTMLYDIVAHGWWGKALDAVGLERDRLPRIARCGEVAGELTPGAAAALQLEPGIPVVLGGMDQGAGAVGAGNVQPEMVSETTGGALAIQVTLTRPDVDTTGRIPVYVHSAPGRYLFVPVCDTAGMALKWFRDTFGAAEVERAAQEGKDAYDLLTEQARGVRPGCEGLIMLPHLTGAFSPEYNPAARGVFYGFTLFHRKPHFARAVLEAVAFMLRRNLEMVAESGLVPQELRSTGGGARSQLWRQIKADVCDLPVVTLRCDDAATLGDAVLAALAVGHFSSLEEACAAMVATAERLEPVPENVSVYDDAYGKYCELNDALGAVFRAQFGKGV
jgi:xylulokinase